MTEEYDMKEILLQIKKLTILSFTCMSYCMSCGVSTYLTSVCPLSSAMFMKCVARISLWALNGSVAGHWQSTEIACRRYWELLQVCFWCLSCQIIYVQIRYDRRFCALYVVFFMSCDYVSLLWIMLLPADILHLYHFFYFSWLCCNSVKFNLIVYNICSSFSKQYAKYDFSKK